MNGFFVKTWNYKREQKIVPVPLCKKCTARCARWEIPCINYEVAYVTTVTFQWGSFTVTVHKLCPSILIYILPAVAQGLFDHPV
jgi:hypothetical protein